MDRLALASNGTASIERLDDAILVVEAEPALETVSCSDTGEGGRGMAFALIGVLEVSPSLPMVRDARDTNEDSIGRSIVNCGLMGDPTDEEVVLLKRFVPGLSGTSGVQSSLLGCGECCLAVFEGDSAVGVEGSMSKRPIKSSMAGAAPDLGFRQLAPSQSPYGQDRTHLIPGGDQ